VVALPRNTTPKYYNRSIEITPDGIIDEMMGYAQYLEMKEGRRLANTNT